MVLIITSPAVPLLLTVGDICEQNIKLKIVKMQKDTLKKCHAFHDATPLPTEIDWSILLHPPMFQMAQSDLNLSICIECLQSLRQKTDLLNTYLNCFVSELKEDIFTPIHLMMQTNFPTSSNSIPFPLNFFTKNVSSLVELQKKEQKS